MQFFKEPKEQENSDSGKKAQQAPPEPKADKSSKETTAEPKVTNAGGDVAGTDKGTVADKPVADSSVTPAPQPKAEPDSDGATPEAKEQGSE